ncbi:MAG: nucleotidyl transferase AbiEii/AbiGii toxin family protein [Candidatus Coatesbacteria bacterium]
MKPLRSRLEEARRKTGLPWEIIERDYLLSWILAGIQEVAALRESLVFKGGTALKKCWFGDYRFSEDLDFTGVGAVPSGAGMEAAMEEVCTRAVGLLDPWAPVEIVCERHVERDPHPGGQEAFDIRAQFPWQGRPQAHVMVEVSRDEPVIMRPARRAVLHEYGEPFDVQVSVYALDEIVAEKLRAILQHQRALERRGWVRSRARDYYDLWRILGAYRDRLDPAGFPALLRAKCAVRGVTFSGPESFFAEAMLAGVRKSWDEWLGPLVSDLPACDRVLGELRPLISSMLDRHP